MTEAEKCRYCSNEAPIFASLELQINGKILRAGACRQCFKQHILSQTALKLIFRKLPESLQEEIERVKHDPKNPAEGKGPKL